VSSWSRSSDLTAFPHHGAPFPPSGPCGSVPRVHRYNGSLRLLDARPTSLRFLRLAVPRMHPLARVGSEGAPRPPGSPCRARRRLVSEETSRSPKFLGSPHAHALRSLTPAGPTSSGPLRRRRCCLPCFRARRPPRSFHFRGSITQLMRSLSTLRSQGRPCTTQDSLPAGGPPWPGGLGYPQDSEVGFSSFIHLHQAGLAHRKHGSKHSRNEARCFAPREARNRTEEAERTAA
jgi:hypothetical protein